MVPKMVHRTAKPPLRGTGIATGFARGYFSIAPIPFLATLFLMRIEVFTLCDASTADPSGKLNLLGAFDTLFASSAPITHPACAVALRLRFENTDEGTHPIELRLVDTDGTSLLPPMKASLNVEALPEMRTISRNFILNFQQLRLPKFGEYTIDLIYNGAQVASIPLYAMSKVEAAQ